MPAPPAEELATRVSAAPRIPPAAVRVRKVVRKKTLPLRTVPLDFADATEEVELGNILSAASMGRTPVAAPSSSRRAPPLPPRSTKPSFLTPDPTLRPPASDRSSATAWEEAPAPRPRASSAELETPSVAPVTFATAPFDGASRFLVGVKPSSPARPITAAAIWIALVVVFGIAAGAVFVLGLPPGSITRTFRGTKSSTSRPGSNRSAGESKAVAAAPDTRPGVRTESPAASESLPSHEPVAASRSASESPRARNVQLLPEAVPAAASFAIPHGMARVSLPTYARGHRFYVDGVVVATESSGLRAIARCGRHVIKIGSKGKPKAVELPCGGEVHLP